MDNTHDHTHYPHHLPKAKPLVPWIGGKRRLASFILPKFAAHSCYVEPFAGAAALFFLKPPARVEVLNDINSDLVNLYRVVQHHLEEFVRQFKWALTSRELFKWLQVTPAHVLTDIQRAARFFYLQQNAFGAKVDQQTFGTATTAKVGINLLRIEEDLSAAHLRLNQVIVEHLDWHACMLRYDRPHTLFYCDPPYWATEGYGVDFPMAEYERLAHLLKTIKGKALVSVNDHPAMRQAFQGLPMATTTIQYTVDGRRPRKTSAELLIANYPI